MKKAVEVRRFLKEREHVFLHTHNVQWTAILLTNQLDANGRSQRRKARIRPWRRYTASPICWMSPPSLLRCRTT